MPFVERLSEAVENYGRYCSERQLRRLLKASNLRYQLKLSSFNISRSDGITREVIQTLKDPELIAQSRNIYIVGPTGVGKTALACACAYNFMEKGHTARFYKTDHLLQDLNAKEEKALKRFRNRMRTIDLLIIDDFGIEKITGSGASRLLDLIDERYGRGATIITSQVSLEAAPNVFSSQSPHVKEAIKDRMFPKNTILIELSGESKRGEADELRDGR